MEKNKGKTQDGDKLVNKDNPDYFLMDGMARPDKVSKGTP